MNVLLTEILKNGMYCKCQLIGKHLMLTQFSDDLLEEYYDVEVKNSHLFVLQDKKRVFIVCLEDNYIKFYKAPKLSDRVSFDILECVFDSFLENFSEVNESMIDLEDKGVSIIPLPNDQFH